VITRALSPTRERRFGSAREMQNALCSEPPSGVQKGEAHEAAGHQSATRIEVPVPRRARAGSSPVYCSATLPVRFAPTMSDGEDTITMMRES
jgi:hypothetical protein